MQLYGPDFDGLDQSDDIAAALKQILDMVKAIDSRLDQVKEDSQVLKNELARVSNNVEDLKRDVNGLKMTLMDNTNTGNESGQSATKESSILPAVRKLVEKYIRNTNWCAMQKGLKRCMEENSIEYQQLLGINNYSWGHLWQVGSNGYQELATLLLDAGLLINKLDNEGDSILHGAAEGGQIQLAQYLLDRGADINLRGWRGLTPFNKAALGGKPEMLRWLADHGADVNSADDVGMTSLHFAAEHGHLEVVWLLVHSGLDTRAMDLEGLTPLAWAKRNRHAAVIGYLSGHAS